MIFKELEIQNVRGNSWSTVYWAHGFIHIAFPEMSSKSTPAQKKSKVKVVFGLAERLPGSVAFPSLLSMELINEKPHGTLWGRVVNEPTQRSEIYSHVTGPRSCAWSRTASLPGQTVHLREEPMKRMELLTTKPLNWARAPQPATQSTPQIQEKNIPQVHLYRRKMNQNDMFPLIWLHLLRACTALGSWSSCEFVLLRNCLSHIYRIHPGKSTFLHERIWQANCTGTWSKT